MIGETLSRYRITGKLGEGGMGVVYRAFDPTLGREVALKVLSGVSVPDTEELERLREEARTIAALNHPNIITVYSVESAADVEFITMELVEGRPLSDVVAGDGIDLDEFLEVAEPMLGAIAAAHRRGITHRDLKPQNVMVGEEGVKILDFGLALRRLGHRTPDGSDDRPSGDAEVHGLQQHGVSQASIRMAHGMPSGTLSYIGPELWRGAPADSRSDIFALGVVLYELLSGRRPFVGTTTVAVVAAILTTEAGPLSRKDVPQTLLGLVQACLDKDPATRPSAGDLLDEVRRVQASRIADPLLVRRRRRAIAVGAPVLAALLFLIARPFLVSRQADEIVAAELLVDAPGSHIQPSLSPDGSEVAFVNMLSDGPPQIWVHRADGNSEPITELPAGAVSPSWSPSGESLLFSTLDGAIWRVGSHGGPPSRVTDDGRNPSWSREGSSFTFERGTQVWISSADGTDQRPLPHIPTSNFADLGRFPALSPDGEWVAFFQPALGPLGDYWVASTRTEDVRQVSSDLTHGGAPEWTSDGEGLIVPFARTGSLTLWWLPVAGGEPIALTTGAGEDSAPDLLGTGTSLAYTNARRFYRIVTLDPETGEERVLLEQRSEVPFPNWSPDGRRISFFRREGTTGLHVFTMTRDGSDVRQVTFGPGEINAMAYWAPDGGLFFYRSAPDTGFYRVPPEGGAPRRIAEFDLQVWPGVRESPDGGRLVVTRAERWLPIETNVVDADDPARVLSSLGVPLRTPEWSMSGDSILGWDDQNRITICPADGAECRRLAPGLEPDWSHDESEIFFLRPTADPQMMGVFRMNRDGSEARPVGEIGPMRGFDVDFDVGPDNLIVWHQTETGQSEVWLAQVR